MDGNPRETARLGDIEMNQAQTAVILLAGVMTIGSTILFAMEVSLPAAWLLLAAALVGYLAVMVMIFLDRTDRP